MFDATSTVRVHDNLDSAVVYNQIIGAIIRGDPNASALALNGNLPVWALSGAFQPLTLLYAIDNPWLAYALTDVIVRLVAFAGALLLAYRFGVSGLAAGIGASCFAISITYSVLALSIAGLPLALWLLDKSNPPNRTLTALRLAGLVFIGWNSALALSGMFFVIAAAPILHFGLRTELRRAVWYGLGAYTFGLVLGNANLIYAQLFSGVTWHRIEFAMSMAEMSEPNWQVLKNSAWDLFSANPWYHVSVPLRWLFIPVFIVAILTPRVRARVAPFLIALCLIAIFWAVCRTPYVRCLRESTGLNAFHFERFYFLSSLLVICVWFATVEASRGMKRNALLIAALCQIALTAAVSDNWSKVRLMLTHGDAGAAKTFDDYYQRDWLREVRDMVERSPVVSVGLDPMIAPMNGVASIDGYYNIYPLQYKRKFRKVIETSVEPSGKKEYFDKWGSRLYTFHPSEAPETLDFCAAHDLGARYVLSNIEIPSGRLEKVLTNAHNSTSAVYRIRAEECGQPEHISSITSP